PSWRAIPLIEACSRRIWLIAHQPARVVNNARGRATCSSCSVNTFVAQTVSSAPRPFPPHQPDRPVEARRVDQRDGAAAMTVRDHATTRATHRRPWRLHTDSEQTDVVVELDAGHMQVPEPDQQVATRAVRGVVMAARSSTRRRLRQRRGLPVRCAWSPPILEASTPLTRTSRHRRAAHPHLNAEEPDTSGSWE